MSEWFHTTTDANGKTVYPRAHTRYTAIQSSIDRMLNRGVEVSSEVADSEHAIILEQVENGVAVRMAVLYLLAQGRG